MVFKCDYSLIIFSTMNNDNDKSVTGTFLHTGISIQQYGFYRILINWLVHQTI